MPIHVVCEACGAEYNLREEFGGRKIQCKSCQTMFRVPQVAVVHGGMGLGSDLGHGDGSEGFPLAAVPPPFRPATTAKALNPIPIRLCVSPEERKKRMGVALVNLDHGKRGWFELYKPAAYKAARELTCDNCGCAAAGNSQAAKESLKRLAVGNQLFPRLSESYLAEEARYIYSGITGWLLKRYLKYPPLGKRMTSVEEFAGRASLA
jgi:hypothetical protein